MSIRSSLVSSAALLTVALLAVTPIRVNAQAVAKVSVSPGASACAQPIDVIVTLTEPARPGGFIVPLQSSAPTVAPIAPNMLIGSGATSGTARIRCVPARQATTVTFSAGIGSAAKSASLSVAAALSDGAVRSAADGTSNTRIAGELSTRTGGTTSTSGTTTGSFGGTTPPPSTTPPGNGTSNTITVGTAVAPTLNGLTLSATEVAGGLSVIARLTATTGSTGVTVSVFPARAQGVTLPTTVVFATGDSAKSIVINTRPQLQPLTVEIIAADSRTPTLRKIAKFVIRPPRIRSIALTSTIVAAGQPVSGTITLDGPAPEGFTVRLTSNGAAVPTPAPIVVQAGATVVSFTLPTAATTANAVVTLTASALGDTATSGIITTVRITP
jgi:hypothetical protein